MRQHARTARHRIGAGSTGAAIAHDLALRGPRVTVVERDVAAVLKFVDDEHGLWRCHGVFECTEVCPADVDPAGLIMGLRQRLLEGERQ